MGTYVHYYLGRDDGIKTAIFENLPHLIKCLEFLKNEHQEEFNADIYKMALYMNEVGFSSLNVNSEEQASLIDRVVDALIFYEELGSVTNVNFQIFEPIEESNMKLHRYANNLKCILPACSEYAEAWYRKLVFEGRSLVSFNGHKYISNDGVFRISWITSEDIERFLWELDPIKTMKNWNDDELIGIHIIYDALCKAKEKNSSLVVQIF